MATILTSGSKAITFAKKELRDIIGVKRLSNFLVKNTSTQCDCGETRAVEVSSNTSFVIVGICASCGN